MKKFFAFIVLILLILYSNLSNAYTLYWFCAAAIKKPSKEIAKLYNKAHKNKVLVIFGGTGQILQQMILSKKGDIYSCMDSHFFSQAESNHLVVKYKKFMRLTPVFALSKKGENKIKTFNDLLKPNVSIAGGNPKTMALGKTYTFIIKKLPKKLSLKLKNNTRVFAINISQIVNYLKISAVDAGIVFKSVAKINKLSYIQIPNKYNQIKTGYLLEMVYGKNKKAKEELFNFILDHSYLYKKYGFELLKINRYN